MPENTCFSPPTSWQGMEFPRPKLKRKRGANLRARLPHKEEESGCHKCNGILIGNSVLVQDTDDVTALVANGFYGKGVFSRSVPTHVTIQDSPTLGTSSEEKPLRKRVRVSQDGREDTVNRKEEEEEETEREKVTDDDTVKEERVVREKEGSHPSTEALCLTGEEAFYLTAEVSRLSVCPSTDTTQCLSTNELWRQLRANHRRFPYTYSAYHHYRRKGWVVRPGAKFGVDYLLYKDGPESYHSSYAVIVQENVPTASEAGLHGGDLTTEVLPRKLSSAGPSAGRREGGGEGEVSSLRWIDVIAHCRVCESTAKELIVCYVTVPCGSCDESDLFSPTSWLDRVVIQEVLVNRWLPEKDR